MGEGAGEGAERETKSERDEGVRGPKILVGEEESVNEG